MPELPEVETMRRGVARVTGAIIQDALAFDFGYKPIRITPSIGRLRQRVRGRKIVDVDRIGKRVLLRLDNQAALVFEPRMTGIVLIADPPNQIHLRFQLKLEKPKGNIFFWDRRGLGSVRLLTASQQQQELGPAKLGPDALLITAEQMQERLGASRRAIKAALLDQRVLAGVGNLYASELLHLARVHPARRCDRLTRRQWSLIHQAMNAILEEAIRYEGSTLSDGAYRNALNQDGGYQNCHRVYDREGEACLTCQTGKIQRIVQSQRSTFFCPHCQTKRPARAVG